MQFSLMVSVLLSLKKIIHQINVIILVKKETCYPSVNLWDKNLNVNAFLSLGYIEVVYIIFHNKKKTAITLSQQ